MKQFKKIETMLLLIILSIGTFLRFYKLSQLMPFIADQGWFYISARDMLISHTIPLVGITSSHIWLHQGALWTYILAIIFALFNFNPVIPAYFTALAGVLTILAVYFVSKKFFSIKIALISALLYSTSPLIITDSRMAYHTSLIPLFTILLIYSVYKWINGRKIFFPVSVFFLAMLYNQEIATFSLSTAFLLILILGIFKKKQWARIFNPRILIYSLAGFLIPMIPMIIYDFHHGFAQTLKFIIWTFYKIALVFGYPPIHNDTVGETFRTFIPFTNQLIKTLIFLPSISLSLIILGLSFCYLFIKVIKQYRSKKMDTGYSLIFIFFLIPSIAYIAAKTNSSAYLLIFYPQVAIMVALMICRIMEKRIFVAPVLFVLILAIFINSKTMIGKNYLTGPSFTKRVEAAQKIIKIANGREYNILGKGEGSIYESFVTPHEYLTWYLGHGPSLEKQKLKFYVAEYPDKIVLEVKIK